MAVIHGSDNFFSNYWGPREDAGSKLKVESSRLKAEG
jgi:hypothetical protein